MYSNSAQLFDLMYAFKDYSQASLELGHIVSHYHPDARSILDVGCSTGRHVEHLREHYDVEGLDINPILIDIARNRNPSVEFHVADMKYFRLGKKFDIVSCLFASIVYVVDLDGLEKAIKSMALHLNPGGLLFIEPWVSPEQYVKENIVLNVAEQSDTKIAWMYVGQEKDNVVTSDVHFLVGTGGGVRHISETHVMALFRQSDYLEAIERAGLDLLRTDDKGFFGNGLYVARLRA